MRRNMVWRAAAATLAFATLAALARAQEPGAVAVPSPAVDLNQMLDSEGNGTVFHKEGVDERVARASLLQPRISAWVEGTVIALEDGKLIVFGRNLPYATLYARMMQDIQKRTTGIGPPLLAPRVKAIQDEWKLKKLSRKELEPTRSDTEMRFELARDRELALVDSDGAVMVHVTGPLHLPGADRTALGAPVPAQDDEEPTNDRFSREAHAAADYLAKGETMSPTEALHIGDRIRVGYDAGARPPRAYIAYPVARPSTVMAIDSEGRD